MALYGRVRRDNQFVNPRRRINVRYLTYHNSIFIQVTQLKSGPIPGVSCSAYFVTSLIENITGSSNKYSSSTFQESLARWTSLGAFDSGFEFPLFQSSWPISEVFMILKIQRYVDSLTEPSKEQLGIAILPKFSRKANLSA